MKQILLIICVVFMAAPAWAFPDNGVLDTFTGADNASLPAADASWTNGDLGSGTGGCALQDNALAPGTTGGNWSCYWNTTVFNADQEVYATWANAGSTVEVTVCGRLVNIGSGTTDGYCVITEDATDTVAIRRVDNEVRSSELSSVAVGTITVGDSIGLKMVGPTICSWFKSGAGAWTQQACVTDSTYTAGGNIGVSVQGNNTVGAADDFGGGNVAAGGQRKRNLMMFE